MTKPRKDETPRAAACRAALREMATRYGRSRPHPRWYGMAKFDSANGDNSVEYYSVSVWLFPTAQQRRNAPETTGFGVGETHIAVRVRT